VQQDVPGVIASSILQLTPWCHQCWLEKIWSKPFLPYFCMQRKMSHLQLMQETWPGFARAVACLLSSNCTLETYMYFKQFRSPQTQETRCAELGSSWIGIGAIPDSSSYGYADPSSEHAAGKAVPLSAQLHVQCILLGFDRFRFLFVFLCSMLGSQIAFA